MPAHLVLREHENAVYLNIEHSTPAWNQLDLLDRMDIPDWRLQFIHDRLRQTGGSRRVVSGNAKRDANVHRLIMEWAQSSLAGETTLPVLALSTAAKEIESDMKPSYAVTEFDLSPRHAATKSWS